MVDVGNGLHNLAALLEFSTAYIVEKNAIILLPDYLLLSSANIESRLILEM